MTPVWVLLMLACYGHTNAKCYPRVQVFDTEEQCAAARQIGGVCFPSAVQRVQ